MFDKLFESCCRVAVVFGVFFQSSGMKAVSAVQVETSRKDSRHRNLDRCRTLSVQGRRLEKTRGHTFSTDLKTERRHNLVKQLPCKSLRMQQLRAQQSLGKWSCYLKLAITLSCLPDFFTHSYRFISIFCMARHSDSGRKYLHNLSPRNSAAGGRHQLPRSEKRSAAVAPQRGDKRGLGVPSQ